jgi:signal transduction histidine kinase
MQEQDDSGLWLLDLTPTARQNWSAVFVGAIVLLGFALAAPFAREPLAELNAFFPSLDAIVFVTDLVTAVLLFAQFSINRSRALLALALGYLFTALIVVPHALTFRGAFSATGLFNAGRQTGSYLFIFWHLGFALALLAYALLRRRWWQNRPIPADRTGRAAVAGAIGVVGLVAGLAWLSTTGAWLLPPIISDETNISRLVVVPISLTMLIAAFAGVVLCTDRRSVLDQWLIVVAFASILELAFSGLIPTVRFSFGFYAGRILSLTTSSIVLIVLLAETTWLYARLARTNAMLRQQSQNKLMNMDAMIASIEHEVRQPLGAISANGDAVILLLDQTPLDLAEVKSTVADMIAESRDIGETFANIRALFGAAEEAAKQPVDVNGLVLEVLQRMKGDCDRQGIKTILELTPKQPAVVGYKGQLRELLTNMVQNAIEAMVAIDGPRTLKIRTDVAAGHSVVLTVEDSGPGVSSERIGTIFDAFVTTKSAGRGLGLAICRMIADRHHGHLSVLPACPRGAVFQVALPTAMMPRERTAASGQNGKNAI